MSELVEMTNEQLIESYNRTTDERNLAITEMWKRVFDNKMSLSEWD